MTVDRARRVVLPLALMLLIAACTAQHDTLSAPATQAAAADLVAVGHAPAAAPAISPLQAVGLAATSLPSSSALAGPHYAFALAAVAVAAELTPDQLDELSIPAPAGLGLRPAAGSQLLVVHVDDQPPPEAVLPLAGAAPVATVVVSGQSRPLRGGVPAANAVLVVSVPVGAAVSLAVRDANRLQSIDLRSGRPGPDPAPLFLPQYTGVAQLLDHIHVDGVEVGHSQLIQLVLTATLRPYLNKQGWAPTGKVWLDLDAVLLVPKQISLKLDLAASLTLGTPDGTVLHLPGAVLSPSTDPDASGNRMAHWAGAVAVPVGLRSLRVGFVVTGTVTRPGSATPLDYGHNQVLSYIPLQLVPRTS